MAVPTTITDLSVTAASNVPAGTDTVTSTTGPDDYIRALASILRMPQAKGADVASATASGLGSNTDGDYFHVTGTTGLAASNFGTVSAGIEKTLVFDGALTLTHNATSFILPAGANITTAAGDVAVFRSEGSGNWKCTNYVRASGAPVEPLLASLAGQTTAANQVQAYSGADTATLLTTGTASGNIPLVGTVSATSTVAGLNTKNLIHEETIAGAAVTSFTSITGLDLATEKSYRIEIDMVNATASPASVSMYANADTTATDYYSQFLLGQGSTTAASLVNTAYIAALDASVPCTLTINLRMIGGYLRAHTEELGNAGSGIGIVCRGWVKTATVANLTQLDFTSSVASSIGIGSTIRIYRGDN